MLKGPLRDDLGAAVPLDGPPRTLASLVPSLSELVAVWGRADDLVAVTEYCTSPADAFGTAVRVRGTKNPDTARLIALRPDLVLADQEENRRIDVDRLRDAGIAVWVTRVRGVADVAATVRRLGGVLDREAEGAALAEAVLAELEVGATGGVAGRSTPSACMIWRDGAHRGADEQWWSVGPETFAGDLLRAAGLPPVVVGDDRRYPRASLAELRAAGPEVVLLPDEPYAFDEGDAAVFAAWPATVLRCSGQPLFWWGPRTPEALRWLRGVAAAQA